MNKTFLVNSVLILFTLNLSSVVFAKEQVTIHAMKHKEYNSSFDFEANRYKRDLYDGTLMSYKSDGLKVYALVNRPTTEKPKSGHPVVIFSHGFHPEPKKYGVSSNGEISRPGDYYRGIPESYAEKGFLVVTPDYRGHNVSEGYEYTRTSYLASSYYASDVLHALAALSSLNDIDMSRIYFIGHSMAGDVGLKVLLANTMIKAASLWSPVVATTDQQALYYSKMVDEKFAPDDSKVDRSTLLQYTKKIDEIYAALPSPVTKHQVDPIHHLKNLSTPLIIHHARGDRSVPYIWSENLVIELMDLNKKFEFHSYDTNNHLFSDANRQKAVKRDVDFFNSN